MQDVGVQVSSSIEHRNKNFFWNKNLGGNNQKLLFFIENPHNSAQILKSAQISALRADILQNSRICWQIRTSGNTA